MKKLLNVLLILAVMFTNLVPASVFAAGKTYVYGEDEGTITINNAVVNETYSIYRLFDVLFLDEDQNIATYALNETFTDTALINKYFDTTESIVDNTTKDKRIIITGTKEGFTGSVVADFAKEALASLSEDDMTASIVAETTTVVFDGLALGYYLVDTSVGTLCMINTTKPTVEINEKNTNKPQDTKSIIENGNPVSTNTAKIGDEVNYEIRLSRVANLSNVVAKDTMEESLDFSASSLKIQVEGKDVTTSAYTLITSTHGFTIKFEDAYLKGMTKEIVITYTAVLNEKAEIAEEGNVNDFKVTYGNKQEIETASVTTYSYEMTLEKVDENGEDLTGAIFQLSQKEKDGSLTLLNVIANEDGSYRIAKENETGATDSIVAGTVRIYGLENGTYSLEETDAPEGYNKLAKPVEFTIEDGNYDGNFQVVNTTGMILPSTGGMGTVLFITVGSIMALGFGVNLVTKARMRKIED